MRITCFNDKFQINRLSQKKKTNKRKKEENYISLSFF
jgi:hypothetical protein